MAVDVCNALDVQNPTERVKVTLDDDEYLPYVIHRSGQQRTVNVVTESGLYALILKSRKPNTRKFRKWITSEVLPSIRKTGSYSTRAFPSTMLPTNCAVLTCRTIDGQSKQAYLLWGDDAWFGSAKWNGDREMLMTSMLSQIANYDKEVVQYERQVYFLKNEIWKASAAMYPLTDKRPVGNKSVENCQKAIDRYNKAKAEMIEFIDG